MKYQSKHTRLFTLAAATCLAAGTLSDRADGAAYYLQVDQGGDWTNTSEWLDDEGNTPTTFDGHDFYSNGHKVRADGPATFGNAETTLYLNSNLVLRGPSTTRKVASLITYAGAPRIGAGQTTTALSVTTFTNNVTTIINSDTGDNRTVTLTIDTLVGSADLRLSKGTTLNLSITNASAFTGNLGWGDSTNATLNFDNDLISGGGLIVPLNGRIQLDQDVTFQSVIFLGVGDEGQTALAQRKYEYNELAELFPTVFLADGSGSITVVPEPAGLLAAAGGCLLVARRRRA